jgi:hypothetical protein
MKIGILTQPLHTNFGGILQAYALQATLELLGHEPLILDRDHHRPQMFRLLLRRMKKVVSNYARGRGDIEFFPFLPTLAQMDAVAINTDKFVQQYIRKTKKIYSTDELKQQVSRHSLDAFVVGSDQVWRLNISPCITNYFLDFLEGEDPSIKRISYAASFGVDYWHYKPKKTQQCKRLAQKFDAISVREDSAVDLCRQYMEIDAQHVLDPTMLLDPDDYRSLVLRENEPESDGDLMTYILDPSEGKTSVVKQVASSLGLKPFATMPVCRLSRETQHCLEECVVPPVTKWLRSFMDANFVIADSFHGCVFAILFNIPFIAVMNKQRGATRFISLLKQFNLTDRLIETPSELTKDLICKPIDWKPINERRALLKKTSMSFLLDSLRI